MMSGLDTCSKDCVRESVLGLEPYRGLLCSHTLPRLLTVSKEHDIPRGTTRPKYGHIGRGSPALKRVSQLFICDLLQ